MNKLTGYTEFTLASGRHIEFKICNATYELYGKARGFTTYKEISDSLTMPTRMEEDEDGNLKEVFYPDLAYTESCRVFMFCAAKYAALAQNKPVDFNEWEVGEWLEEVGQESIFNSIEQPPASAEPAKKKGKKPLIRATQ